MDATAGVLINTHHLFELLNRATSTDTFWIPTTNQFNLCR